MARNEHGAGSVGKVLRMLLACCPDATRGCLSKGQTSGSPQKFGPGFICFFKYCATF